MAVGLLDAAILLGLAAIYVRPEVLRTRRTALLMAGVAATYALSTLMPSGLAFVTRAGLVGALLAVQVLGLTWPLASLTKAELDFDEALRRIVDPVVKAGGGPDHPWQSAEFRRQVRDALGRLKKLNPPTADWARVLTLVEDHLGFVLSVIEGSDPRSLTAWETAARQWAALHEEWISTRRRRSRFWR